MVLTAARERVPSVRQSAATLVFSHLLAQSDVYVGMANKFPVCVGGEWDAGGRGRGVEGGYPARPAVMTDGVRRQMTTAT